jgi:hypothetical protein
MKKKEKMTNMFFGIKIRGLVQNFSKKEWREAGRKAGEALKRI